MQLLRNSYLLTGSIPPMYTWPLPVKRTVLGCSMLVVVAVYALLGGCALFALLTVLIK